MREAGCDGAGEPARLRRDVVLFWRLRETLPTTGGRTGTVEDIPGSGFVDTPAVMLRVLALEGVRWWRRVVVRGWEKPEVEVRCCEDGSGTWVDSAPDALADVEEALDTTEAFWAARRSDSSRVRRLTCDAC